MLEAVGIGIIIGWLKGGKLGNLARQKIECTNCILLSLLLTGIILNVQLRQHVISFCYFISFLALITGLLANRTRPGFTLINLGVLANFTVIILNGMKMPVSPRVFHWIDPLSFHSSAQALTHSIIDSSTKVDFLADILIVPRRYMLSGAYSVGDIFMIVGIIIAFQSMMRCEESSVESPRTS